MNQFRIKFPSLFLLLGFGPLGCPASNPNAGSDEGQTSGIMSTSLDGTDTMATGGSEASVDGSGTETVSATDTEGSADTEMNCGEVDFQLEAVPPNVVLVLDKSGSMVSENDADNDGEYDGYWDHDNDPNTPLISRWNSLYNVVDFVVNGFDTQINFGAVLFPGEGANNQYGPGACVVANTPTVPVAPMNAAQILSTIPAATATNLQGATPATAGITTAIEHLETLDPEIPRFMILVTDGAANCSADATTNQELMEVYDENLPIVVGDAYNDLDIATFVVGIDIVDALTGSGNDGAPEANTFERLNDVAVAGGFPRPGNEKFFNTINEIELMDALSEIAGQVVSCVVPLDMPPVHPNFVEVEIGGMVIPRVEDCATEDGWVWVNPDGPYDAIELCGTACEALVDVGTVDATFGCPPSG